MAQRFTQYFNPVLTALKELGNSARPQEVYAKVAGSMKLSDSERDETNKSGVRRFENDIAWARSYLVKTGHIDKSQRGVWSLTEKVKQITVLSEEDISEILQSVQQELQQTKKISQIENELDSPPEDDPQHPHRQWLLETMKALPPEGFERLCQRLLRESGFEQVEVTGKSSDGGIDGIGILKINPFVALKVLFQC
jgi:restriction system protein